MTKKKVWNFSAEEKTKIALELLKEDITISQLSYKYEVSSNSISHWKNLLLSTAVILFSQSTLATPIWTTSFGSSGSGDGQFGFSRGSVQISV